MVGRLWWKVVMRWRGIASVSWRGRKVFLDWRRVAFVMRGRVLLLNIMGQRWWEIVLAWRLERGWDAACMFCCGWKVVGVRWFVLL